ncbi:MAG: CcmD family protein [Dehalococcoidia bacterium]|nr:CcmD family protein [Dehalococcoidia bacterium]
MFTNANYIAAAFAVVWVGVFIYVFALMQKERNLRRNLESLKEELKNRR